MARARQDESVAKLANAGADRVVNPQELGAARMASFVVRPHVAEFVDVVMHERSIEFRMQEYDVPEGSALAGKTLREADLRKPVRRRWCSRCAASTARSPPTPTRDT